MRILLDTHVWLWMITQPRRIQSAARMALANQENVLFLSAASAWEIAVKQGLGKLSLPETPAIFVPSRLIRDGVLPLPVTLHHALGVASLPPHHRDPFVRLLIAQAQLDGLTLFTADAAISAYDVEHVLVA